MNIFFNKKRKTFVHHEKSDSPIFWGVQDELLPLASESRLGSFAKIKVKKIDRRIGPLVGILTSKTKQGVISNRDVLINIQQHLQLTGGLSFVYTLEDCRDQFIHGSFYAVEENCWFKAIFPLPNIIYNRISSRREEKTDKFLEHKSNMISNQIPFFNPCFIDKFSMHQLFSKNPLLFPLLPPTKLITKPADLEDFLSQHPCIYLKPTLRSQGNGIYYIKKEENGRYYCQKGTQKYEFFSFIDIWSFIEKSTKKTPYIAQMEINSAKFDDNKYDYRILSHFINNEFSITGIGIRVADSGRITTHVSKGGYILPYEKIRQPSLEKVFHWILQECGKTLSNEYGPFKEFTIDMGRDQSGKLWIYEVNAKPMTFDEEAIETKRLINLISIFYDQTIYQAQ